jgi:hypothetical protein
LPSRSDREGFFTREWERVKEGLHGVFRREIFDYIKVGEELVLEPFNRLINGVQVRGLLAAHGYVEG